MQPLLVQRVGQSEQERSVGIGPHRQPLRIEEVRRVLLEGTHVDEVDAVVPAALEPAPRDVASDPARVDLCVLQRDPAEHHHQLRVLRDHRPRGHGVQHVEELETEHVRHDHLGRGGAVAVHRVGVAAEHLQEAVDLTLGVVKAPGAGPAVGAREDRLVAVQRLDPAELARREVEGLLPADGDEWLVTPAAAVLLRAALEPALAHRRLHDAGAVVNAVLEGLADV